MTHPINLFTNNKQLRDRDYNQIWDDAFGFGNIEVGQGWGGIGGLSLQGKQDYFEGWREEIVNWYKEVCPELIEG